MEKNQNNKSESYKCLICLRSLFSVNLKLAVWLVDFDGVTDIITFCFSKVCLENCKCFLSKGTITNMDWMLLHVHCRPTPPAKS